MDLSSLPSFCRQKTGPILRGSKDKAVHICLGATAEHAYNMRWRTGRYRLRRPILPLSTLSAILPQTSGEIAVEVGVTPIPDSSGGPQNIEVPRDWYSVAGKGSDVTVVPDECGYLSSHPKRL